MLKARASLHLYAARLVDVPNVQARSLLVLVNELPDAAGTEVTAINFGNAAVDEAVAIRGAAAAAQAVDAMDPRAPAVGLSADGKLHLHLDAFEAKALQLRH
jgi:maltose alpha-D-glucosyltransferase/alpha-amylase